MGSIITKRNILDEFTCRLSASSRRTVKPSASSSVKELQVATEKIINDFFKLKLCQWINKLLIQWGSKHQTTVGIWIPETIENGTFWSLDFKWFGIQMVSLWAISYVMELGCVNRTTCTVICWIRKVSLWMKQSLGRKVYSLFRCQWTTDDKGTEDALGKRDRPYIQCCLVNVTRPDKWSHNTILC